VIPLFPELEEQARQLEQEQHQQIAAQLLEEAQSTIERVRWVFQRWQEIYARPRSKMDAAREKVIRDRLRDGYEPADLELALYGCKFSDFHQGNNDRGEKYDTITLILRSADHVDKFIALAENVIARKRREHEARAGQQAGAQNQERNRAAYLQFLEQARAAGIKVRAR
jgi:hypothetical protein